MGEMADLLTEHMENMDDLYFDNLMYEEESDAYYPPRQRRRTVCKYCKSTPLKWRQILGKWVLFDMNGDLHTCSNYLPSIEILQEIKRQKMDKEKMPKQLLPIPSWDEQYMHDVYWWARRSKDPRTKIGAVLVRPYEDRIPFSHAYNGFARKVNDDVPERWERPEKYEWVTHAEENAVLNCSRRGIATAGSTMYTQGVPCTRCADAVIQGGVVEVVVHEQWQAYEKKFGWDKWIDSARRSEQKFKEAGVNIRIFGGNLGMQGVLDGKVISV